MITATTPSVRVAGTFCAGAIVITAVRDSLRTRTRPDGRCRSRLCDGVINLNGAGMQTQH
jgi:hypothetical protein